MSQTVEFEMNKQLKNYIVIVKNMSEDREKSFYENTDLDFDVILLTKDNQIYISEGIAQNFTSDYTVNVLKK